MKISTFSIVARDPKTGEIGVGGGTNWFCYGRWVPHIEAGIGAVATQAETNMWYAPNSIVSLKKGMTVEDTIKEMLDRQPDVDGVYQLLVIDKNGNVACHTGKKNPVYAGHVCEQNLGVAGNTLVSEATLKAVIDTFKKTSGALGFRMIKALQAGQAAGGDIRGMKSAALKVAKAENTGEYWNDIVFDLRVDENQKPLEELERIYRVAEAYSDIGEAEDSNNLDQALIHYRAALKKDPENTEVMFWMARIYFRQGKTKEAELLRAKISQVNPHWDEFWKRLDARLPKTKRRE